MRIKAKITSKGQTTVPSAVRDYLKLKTGDSFEYVLENGKIYLHPKNLKLADLAGILGPPPKGAGASLEDFDTAIANMLAEDDKRIRDDWNRHQRAGEISRQG